MLLQGRNAIVTGGSQGIGAATSIEFAKEGANVCLLYRKHEEEALRLADEIRKMGRKALPLPCNIASFPEVEKVVQTALKEFGRI
ncbi:MAG: SDR family NAD(P)-dependent oxidoreductase, partial [Desulfobacteraceae bacterium]